MEFTNIKETSEQLKNKKISIKELSEIFIDRINNNLDLNAYIYFNEENIRDQMARMLGSDGFNEEDILGITVNRWPHGYTYTYNSLFDPEDWAYTSTTERPAVKARKKFGQIAIANADAAASPHTDAAINEAYRAVIELSKR